ncbi:MAG: tetratricopeptide repeat protein [Nitrococcus sp.]|nr:tetratricopeptide repeat protein [Nitrococcus sp.]
MHRCLIFLLLLLSAGCTTSQALRVDSIATSAVKLDQAAAAESSLLYHLMVAELAGSHGDLERAASEYLNAARLSSDPSVAERAARIALLAGREDLALAAAARWHELAPGSIEARQALGLLSLRSGDLDAAVEQLASTVQAASGGAAQGFATLAGMLSQESDSAAALQVMQRIAAKHPNNRASYYAVAQLALTSEQSATALAALNKAIALSPQWPEAHLLRVQTYLRLDRPQAALDELDGLLRESPRDYDLRLQYAHILVRLSRTREALAEFRKLLEREPDDIRALYPAALLAIDAQLSDQAKVWLQRLLALGEHPDAAHYFLGRVAEQQSNYQTAISYYGRTRGAYRGEAQLRIAVVLAEQGQVGQARVYLRELRGQNSQLAARTYGVEGEIMRTMGQLQDSLQAYETGLAAFPNDRDLLYGRAMTLIEMDRLPAAEHDLRAILAKDPNDPHALNALGYTLADRTDRLQEAARLVQRAYAQRPHDPAIIDSMGWLAYRQGRLHAALSYLSEAWKLGKDPEIGAHYGEILWKLGHRDKARRIWQQALQSHADNAMLTNTIKRLTQ